MKVKMTAQLTGTRNGVRWPAPGSVVEVGPSEGADLCGQRVAVPVVESVGEKAEKRPTKRAAEKRG